MTSNDTTNIRGSRLCHNLYNFTQKDNYQGTQLQD